MSTLYYKGKSYTPSEVEANPSGDPTDILETIGIGGVNYGIAGGGGGITPPKTIYKAPSYDGAALSTDVPYDNGFILDGDETLIITYCDPIDSALFGTIAIPPSLIGTPIYYTGYLRRVNYTTFGLSSFNQSRSSTDGEDGGYSPRVYQIDVIKTSGNFFTPQIYSTEEREVGVWIDGKPLYQKTVRFLNVIPKNSWVMHSFGIDNIDTIVNVQFDRIRTDNNVDWSLNYNNSGSYFNAYWNTNGLTMYWNYSNASNIDVITTIIYTKSTDTAGSAKYNTLGVPTVHYDDTEKIVGTWFGETLYEKSYVITSIPSSGTTIDNVGNIGISPYIKGSFLRLGRWYNMDGRTESANYSQYYCYAQVMNNGDIVLSYDGYNTSEITKICITIQYTKTT